MSRLFPSRGSRCIFSTRFMSINQNKQQKHNEESDKEESVHLSVFLLGIVTIGLLPFILGRNSVDAYDDNFCNNETRKD